MEAIRIIQDEHRSLAAVLHGMLFLVHEVKDQGAKPDFAVLGAMVHYIDTVPERFHHPKEDRYLFARLRARCAEAAPVLDALHAEHAVCTDKVRALEQALSRYEHGGAEFYPAFAQAVEDFAAFHWNHMGREETEVLPLARAHLSADDWAEIDAAFKGHTDPLFGADAAAQQDKLFTRIVNLAPPPIGLGPAT